MFEIVLAANAIWFGMGFYAFALRGRIFAKTIVPKENRETPVFEVLVETGKFLGGFNFALCAFNVLLLINSGLIEETALRVIVSIFFALAHGSQFVFNVPIALKNRKGIGVWQVKGTMRFIFVTDFVMMAGNLAIAFAYKW